VLYEIGACELSGIVLLSTVRVFVNDVISRVVCFIHLYALLTNFIYIVRSYFVGTNCHFFLIVQSPLCRVGFRMCALCLEYVGRIQSSVYWCVLLERVIYTWVGM